MADLRGRGGRGGLLGGGRERGGRVEAPGVVPCVHTLRCGKRRQSSDVVSGEALVRFHARVLGSQGGWPENMRPDTAAGSDRFGHAVFANTGLSKGPG